MAISGEGSLWSPGPAFYMDKLVAPPQARGAARIADPPEVTVRAVAAALGKDVRELRIVVLDKPRHEQLSALLRELGAIVITPSAGDVAGALAVLLPDGEADLLLGIGGTPEGVLAACAARALGGEMQGRVAPQRDDERARVQAAGLSTEKVLELEELVADDAAFIATGVTGGMLAAPHWSGDWVSTDSIVIAAGAVRRISQTCRQI
jgi:fructose-1,6-bisphosphatase II